MRLFGPLIGALLTLLTLLPSAVLAQAPFAVVVVAKGLHNPVFATAPVGDPRLFIVEQEGKIRILSDGELAAEPFLDVSDLIGSISLGGEQGLLGLAFHPEYGSNGRFFVNYTDRDGNTHVVGYTVSSDPGIADTASATEVLAVDQPYENHNGGWIEFGPDGLLYVAMGDGGSGGDPHGNGQNMDARLGKILRADIDNGGGWEIFASGVRNPWRNAFDGDQLYIADVGQETWEEVDVVSISDSGVNLGWNIMEGAVCFESESCDQTGLTLPVHVYDHETGCSITGGYVYRGSAIPALVGHYLFGDYCSGSLYSFRYEGGVAKDVADWSEALGRIGYVTSFGKDSTGELYITVAEGQLLKLVAAP